MTPSLNGRIQTRLALNSAIALPILTLVNMGQVFFIMLAVGVALDFFYNWLQQKRWDGDWPPILSLLSLVAEGVILWFVLSLKLKLKLDVFVLLYGTIALLTFLGQIILGVLIPYKKFKDGRIL